MDDVDRAIIWQLEREGRLTNQELASRVGLTPGPCLRRVKRLEADGVIQGYRAVINPAAQGKQFEVTILADVTVTDASTLTAFEDDVAALDEVVEMRRMFGSPHYMIRVQAQDLQEYEHWMVTKLLSHPSIQRTDSRITMKIVKR